MKRTRSLLIVLPILFVLIVVLAACARQAEQPSGPRIRVTNAGTIPIEDLVILFPDERIAIGDISPGETSEYVPVENGVYGYAAYEYTQNGETVTQPVLDWMGATPLQGSDFTYEIDFDPTRPAMQQILAREVITD